MKRVIGACLLLVLAATAAPSLAQTVSLSNNGSTATINAGTSGTTGLNAWQIGAGADEVGQQVFAYNLGSGAAVPINTISAPVIVQPTSDLADITYANTSFSITTRYLLTGASPNSADLSEVLTLTNLTASPLTVHLFEYDFLTLAGAAGGTGTLLNSTTINQTRSGTSMTVGSVNVPDHWMIGASTSVQTALGAGLLTDTQTPFTTTGNMSFAFQWNVTVPVGQTWQLGKTKHLEVTVVPDPAVGGLLACGAGLMCAAARRPYRRLST
jgi:hypothetical protein